MPQPWWHPMRERVLKQKQLYASFAFESSNQHLRHMVCGSHPTVRFRHMEGYGGSSLLLETVVGLEGEAGGWEVQRVAEAGVHDLGICFIVNINCR